MEILWHYMVKCSSKSYLLNEVKAFKHKKHSCFLLYRTLQQIVAWLSAEPGTKQSLRAYSNKYKKPTWLTYQATKQQLRVDYQAQEEGYSSMEQDQTKTHYDWV